MNLSDIQRVAHGPNTTSRKLFQDVPFYSSSENRNPTIPPIAFYDVTESYIIFIQLAGVKKEDIELIVTRDYLIINAEPEEYTDVTNDQQLYSEIPNSSFSRRLALPSKSIDLRRMSAEYENCILKVTLPKSDTTSNMRVWSM